MHRQLSTIVGNRLGRQHAQLLSRPEIDPNGGSIAWFSAPLGPVRKLADLAKAAAELVGSKIAAAMADSGGEASVAKLSTKR